MCFPYLRMYYSFLNEPERENLFVCTSMFHCIPLSVYMCTVCWGEGEWVIFGV